MAGSETEMVGVMRKSKETAGLEAETVVGTEGGVGMKVATDSKLTVDMSRNIGGAVGTGSTMASMVADEMGSMAAGTDTGDDAVAVMGVQVSMIVEMIPSVCVVVSEFSAPANEWLGIAGTEMERAG